ncbi:MAG TPA: hypothetical protein VEN82_03390 [Actinomycetota bacterium]|nr:hypothetical protein [Actinomycetota bacterium]
MSRRGSNGRTRRVLGRSLTLALAPVAVLLSAGVSLADVQVTPFYSDTPGPAGCSLTSPASSCGQWTYWMSIGAVIVGLVIIGAVVLGYLRLAPRFAQDQEPAMAGARAAGGAPPRPAATTMIAPPPEAAAAPAQAAAAPAQAAAAPASSAVETTPADATVEAGTPAAGAPSEPAAAPVASAAPVAAPRPTAERPPPVDPDPETFDRVLAEQLAKGTDRRVAEGRAKAAALKAAREKAAGA